MAMKKMKWIVMGILLLTCSASAQQAPRVDVSTGYSFLRLGGSGGTSQQGGSISIAGNLNHWLGIVGDFGGYHSLPFGVRLNTYTTLLGPRFSLRTGRVTPFVQTLFGGAHMSASVNGISAGKTSFAINAGGGIDLRLSHHLALRPQVDYIALRSSGQTLNSGRASLGLVCRFGER
jgi:Outer membrane protein beta-barrel domain